MLLACIAFPSAKFAMRDIKSGILCGQMIFVHVQVHGGPGKIHLSRGPGIFGGSLLCFGRSQYAAGLDLLRVSRRLAMRAARPGSQAFRGSFLGKT